MKIITEPDSLATVVNSLPPLRILVPTMGALHEGHLALIHHARKLATDEGSVILSIFVNPTQFDKTEDLKNYPRTLENDISLCRELGVDLVFAPDPSSMYHSNHSITVTETSLSEKLCGASRPGHFDGVCTVVLKLFNLTGANIAVFGKKDYQQLAIIRRMVRDLNIPISIEGVETIRSPSGLALSSRNTRLTKEQYKDASRIRRALLTAQRAYANGEKSGSKLIQIVRKEIESSKAGASIDYLELIDTESLQIIDSVSEPAIIATAVFYGDVRLIDNLEITPSR